MTPTTPDKDSTAGYWPLPQYHTVNPQMQEQLWTDPSSFDLSEPALRWSLPLLSNATDALAGGITWALHPSFCDNLLPMFPEENYKTILGFSSSFLSCSHLTQAILPLLSNATDALAGGITWALHPSFCDNLLPMFPEENYKTILGFSSSFLSCSHLTQAISDALETWASNHKWIHFEDVTAQCAKPGAVVGKKCTAAEIFLMVEKTSDGQELAAFVVNNLQNLDPRPFTTAGQQIRGRGLRDSQMTVSSSICWYLDATFCYTFHDMNSNGMDGIVIMRIVFAVAYVFSILVIMSVVARGINAVLCPNKGETPGEEVRTTSGKEIKSNVCGGQRCDGILEIIENMPLCILLSAIFWLIFMPIFYYRVFLPCWDCFDFQATIAHEIGHVLGFDHPDTLPHKNLRALSRHMAEVSSGDLSPPDAPICLNPMQYVELKPLPEEADSIMFSTTRHRGRTCLTEDDLDGLNLLYPTCSGAVEQPKCVHKVLLRGWLRLGVAVGFPFVLTVLLLLLLQSSVKLYQRRKVKRLEAVVRTQENRLGRLKRDCSALRHKLSERNYRWSAKKTSSTTSHSKRLHGVFSSFASNFKHFKRPADKSLAYKEDAGGPAAPHLETIVEVALQHQVSARRMGRARPQSCKNGSAHPRNATIAP
eukprot:CAMPEP_0119344124 /NCGR_PEP_ID=MMETSP1333-20130426/106809_1 /TAXON_ID=418940 /ORGANISM="Scyphosphaera apsteinii, Strain RCC1455" /LENGTH=647 /DNA_ID=CAMNT_0007356551 /DNA_START=125 /DNA_END=2068 /DNA_ORIENTATION=-